MYVLNKMHAIENAITTNLAPEYRPYIKAKTPIK